jgi:hypothetical protein
MSDKALQPPLGEPIKVSQGQAAALIVWSDQAGPPPDILSIAPWPKTEMQPVWPLAENNQGLLSLIALVAALFFGLYEYRKSRREGDDRRREYITLVSGVIDEILNFTGAIRFRFEGGEAIETCVRDWQSTIIAPRFLMNAIRATPPNDVVLAIEAQRLWHSLQMSDGVDPAGAQASQFKNMETNLRGSKAVFRSRW